MSLPELKNTQSPPVSQPVSADFRLHLQQELIRRCKANPLYSLRAFARMLGVSNPYLSMVFSKKRTLTVKAMRKMAVQLNLSPTDIQQYEAALLGNLKRKKQSNTPNASAAVSENYHPMTLDHFNLISDWYHFAILELITLSDFKPDYKWISRTLGINVSEARAAVERLCRLEMLEIDSNNKWKNSSGNNTVVENELVAVARRKLQKQILEKAITALEELPTTQRDQSAMTLACSSKKLIEVKKRIKEFRRELTHFLQEEEKENRDTVYHLSVSFYPVTRLIPAKKKARKRQ